MSEEEIKTEEQGLETEEEKPAISNSDVKNHELFVKLTKQLADYQRKEKAEKENAEKAARDAELKKAEEEQNWKKLIEMREQELEQTKAQHAKELLDMQLKAAISADFNNPVFVKGAMASFDGDMDSISEYVESLKADPINAGFLKSAMSAPNAPNPPSTPTVTGGKLSEAKLVAMEKSSNPAERAKAREYLENLIKQGEKLPNK